MPIFGLGKILRNKATSLLENPTNGQTTTTMFVHSQHLMDRAKYTHGVQIFTTYESVEGTRQIFSVRAEPKTRRLRRTLSSPEGLATSFFKAAHSHLSLVN